MDAKSCKRAAKENALPIVATERKTDRPGQVGKLSRLPRRTSPEHFGQAVRAGTFKSGTQCAHLHVGPKRRFRCAGPLGGDDAQDHRKRVHGPDLASCC